MRLSNWIAKRAGGRITITGQDAETGLPTKVVGVDAIRVTNEGVIVAVDRNCNAHILQSQAA